MKTPGFNMADVELRPDDKPHQLDKLRIKILFGQSLAVQLGGVIIASIYVFLFRHKASFNFLLAWSASLLILSVMRFALIKFFHHYYVKLGRDFDPQRWENIFVSFLFVSGLLWGFAVCMAFPVGDISSDALLSYILAGITAGAAVAYSTSLKSTYCFFLPSVLPFVVRLALKGDEVYLGMAIMMFAYVFIYLKLTHQFHKYAMDSIILSFQKDKLIERIRLMQSKVTESAQMAALGRMAGGMAHEINNPLGIVMVSVETLQGYIEEKDFEKIGVEAPSCLSKMNNAVERIGKVVKELRSFSGRPGDEQYETVSVAKIIETASNFCQERFKVHHILFYVEQVAPHLMIECRPFHMTQVILNLLNNAYDAIVEKGERWIRLEVFDLGERVEIAVTDSGQGIPEEVRSKIMQPFFTTKEVGKGMGLGLSVSKGIIDSHRGQLTLDEGSLHTRFIVSLPKTKSILTQNAA